MGRSENAEDSIAFEDRALPIPERSATNLKVCRKVFHEAECIEIDSGDALKEVVSLGCIENESGNSLFDDLGPSAVLDLINACIALPLAAKQLAGYGGPP
jgi:hypothetical protein